MRTAWVVMFNWKTDTGYYESNPLIVFTNKEKAEEAVRKLSEIEFARSLFDSDYYSIHEVSLE